MPPTAHTDGDKDSLLDQLFDRQPRVGGGDAIVVAQVVRRRDAERAGRAREERPPGVNAAWRGELEDRAGQHPLGQIVYALKAASAVCCGDQSRPEQPFQRLLGGAPRPHALRGFAVRHIGSSQRPLRLDAGEQSVGLAPLLPRKRFEAPPHAIAAKRAGHTPAQQGLAVDRQQRRLVPPIFKEASGLGCDQRVEEGRFVGTQAGEERQILSAHENVHAVDLKDAELFDALAQLRRADSLRATHRVETLRGKRDATSFGSGEFRLQCCSPATVEDERAPTTGRLALPIIPLPQGAGELRRKDRGSGPRRSR